MDKSKVNKKYRLHSKIRKAGFILNTSSRTILFPYGSVVPENKHLKQLISEYGYIVQFTITE